MSPSYDLPNPVPPDARFRTTRWSMVRAAGEQNNAESAQAMAELCQAYWYPLYAIIRRRCPDQATAQDLTQEFFARVLEKGYVAAVRPERGRFRTFLRVALQRFVSNEWNKSRAQKRGGNQLVLSLDFAGAESRNILEPTDGETPEHLFDRQWALQLLELVQQRLREEYVASGKLNTYEKLKPLLIGMSEDYSPVAQELGMTPGAARTAVYRMRQRFRELLRFEIAQTVADPNEIEDEIRELFAVLG